MDGDAYGNTGDMNKFLADLGVVLGFREQAEPESEHGEAHGLVKRISESLDLLCDDVKVKSASRKLAPKVREDMQFILEECECIKRSLDLIQRGLPL